MKYNYEHFLKYWTPLSHEKILRNTASNSETFKTLTIQIIIHLPSYFNACLRTLVGEADTNATRTAKAKAPNVFNAILPTLSMQCQRLVSSLQGHLMNHFVSQIKSMQKYNFNRMRLNRYADLPKLKLTKKRLLIKKFECVFGFKCQMALDILDRPYSYD